MGSPGGAAGCPELQAPRSIVARIPIKCGLRMFWFIGLSEFYSVLFSNIHGKRPGVSAADRTSINGVEYETNNLCTSRHGDRCVDRLWTITGEKGNRGRDYESGANRDDGGVRRGHQARVRSRDQKNGFCLH